MTVPFKKNKFANRGKKAEDAVGGFLLAWAGATGREANRLVDTKAAGRTIKAAAADFEFFCLQDGSSWNGLIEVKQTEHEYRLERSKVPQLPRLRKREQCGGLCVVLVLHSTTGVWRAATAGELSTTGDKGSWNLTDHPQFKTAGAALAAIFPEVFG